MRRIVPLLIVLVALPAPARAAGDPSRDVLWAALKTCVLAKKVADRTFSCLDVDLGDKERPGGGGAPGAGRADPRRRHAQRHGGRA